MPFKYCIAIDVEKTTEGPEISKEIIEFGAVAFDLSTNQSLSEFHSFVKPKSKEDLSEWCKNFTGISQETIQKSPSLGTMIAKFMIWVRQLKQQHGLVPITRGYIGNCCIITWSENDLRSLHHNFISKNMSRPNIFAVGLDLQAVFAKHYAHINIQRLQNAVEQVGLVFEGKAHSAKYDALNLALLAGFMAKAKGILIGSDHVMYLKAIN